MAVDGKTPELDVMGELLHGPQTQYQIRDGHLVTEVAGAEFDVTSTSWATDMSHPAARRVRYAITSRGDQVGSGREMVLVMGFVSGSVPAQPSMRKRWLREPLLHFLLAGLALFLVHRALISREASS